LSRFFGNTPDFWMNLQLRWDLYFVKQRESETLSAIVPVAAREGRAAQTDDPSVAAGR